MFWLTINCTVFSWERVVWHISNYNTSIFIWNHNGLKKKEWVRNHACMIYKQVASWYQGRAHKGAKWIKPTSLSLLVSLALHTKRMYYLNTRIHKSWRGLQCHKLMLKKYYSIFTTIITPFFYPNLLWGCVRSIAGNFQSAEIAIEPKEITGAITEDSYWSIWALGVLHSFSP